MSRGNSYSSILHHDSMQFLVITWIKFSLQGNAISVPSVIIKRISWFGRSELCFELKACLIAFFYVE